MLIRKMDSDLVGTIDAGVVVVERPAVNLAMNEMTVIVPLVRPQSRDPACLAMLAPEYRIDPVVCVKRRDDDVGDAGVSLGVTRFSCKFNANLAELGWM